MIGDLELQSDAVFSKNFTIIMETISIWSKMTEAKMKSNKIPLSEIPTESFSSWLEQTKGVLSSDADADVPCAECNVCCRSSLFIHLRPDDTQALAHIPKELLFEAPGLPKGNKLLGYNEEGACPMLVDNRCSIYQYRPKTCRRFDCRVLCATGLSDKGGDSLISKQAQRWEFSYSSDTDKQKYLAVKQAVEFLLSHADSFPPGFIPSNNIQQAILAIQVYELFLTDGDHAELEQTADIEKTMISLILEVFEE